MWITNLYEMFTYHSNFPTFSKYSSLYFQVYPDKAKIQTDLYSTLKTLDFIHSKQQWCIRVGSNKKTRSVWQEKAHVQCLAFQKSSNTEFYFIIPPVTG